MKHKYLLIFLISAFMQTFLPADTGENAWLDKISYFNTSYGSLLDRSYSVSSWNNLIITGSGRIYIADLSDIQIYVYNDSGTIAPEDFDYSSFDWNKGVFQPLNGGEVYLSENVNFSHIYSDYFDHIARTDLLYLSMTQDQNTFIVLSQVFSEDLRQLYSLDMIDLQGNLIQNLLYVNDNNPFKKYGLICSVSNDGSSILYGDSDWGYLLIKDSNTLETQNTIYLETQDILATWMCEDNQHLAVNYVDNSLDIMDLKGQVLRSIQFDNPVKAFNESFEQPLFTLMYDGNRNVYNAEGMQISINTPSGYSPPNFRGFSTEPMGIYYYLYKDINGRRISVLKFYNFEKEEWSDWSFRLPSGVERVEMSRDKRELLILSAAK